MELTRIKMIEDENSRCNQTLDKSNRGNLYYYNYFINFKKFARYFIYVYPVLQASYIYILYY